MLTFRDIFTQVLTFLDQASDVTNTGTPGLALVKYAINSAHAKRLTSERWSFMLWPKRVPVAFQSGVREYMLHPLAGMVADFHNATAKQQMHETPTRARYKTSALEDRFHFEFVAPSPIAMKPVGFAPNTTPGVLTITGTCQISYVSDAAQDVVTETVTNSVTSANAIDVVSVTKLDANTLSIVDSASNTLLSLTAPQFGKTYPQIHLFQAGQAETGYYRFYKIPTYLTNDYDIPDIPFPYSHILIYDSLLEIATYNDSVAPEFWLKQADKWELQLAQAFQEGEMEGSETRVIQEVDMYGG